MSEVRVPVFMYHSIGIPDPEWKWNYLTTPWQDFESEMKWLKLCGFNAIHFDAYYDYIFNGKALPKNPVMLTFDDGYADNYIFAYPIMKKYGMVGTVYVNSDFIDPREIKRPLFSGGTEPATKDCRGFLTVPEMRELEESNVLRMESHAQTHTWYPISGKIIDYRHPNDRHDWMTWNDHPDKKPFLQVDDEKLVNYGAPVYENEKSLMARRYIPEVNISNQLQQHVKDNGGSAFFDNPEWRDTLNKLVIDQYGSLEVPGKFESEQEQFARVQRELNHCQDFLKSFIDRPLMMVAWPGGSGSEAGLEAAKNLGIKLSTAGKDLRHSVKKNLLNIPSQKSDRVKRISPVTYHDNVADFGSKIVYCGGPTTILKILIFKNWLGARYWGNGILLGLQTIYKLLK